MIRRASIIMVLAMIFSGGLHGQDKEYAKKMIHLLASDSMVGRGYQQGGDLRAAEYVRSEFKRHGLEPLGDDYYQPVTFGVNSIVSVDSLKVDGVSLIPGVGFFISARSTGRERVYKLEWLDHKTAGSRRSLKRLARKDLSGSLLVIDPEIVADKEMRELYAALFWGQGGDISPKLKPAGIVMLTKKPGWHISDSGKETGYIVLTVRQGLITSESRELSIGFDAEYQKAYRSNNVAGMVRGRVYPDSFILFTAHYDHLGKMGPAIIPGANDNASGTAMITDLARHYAQNRPEMSVVFVAFTGEEAGLLGSEHFATNPLVSLSNIVLMLNLDMVGTGSEGITMVNGAIYREYHQVLDSINRAHQFLPVVKARGESANSDHYPFYKRGVKAFFIYTMGQEFREYHNIYDRPGDLPLTRYEELFRLLVRYADYYMRCHE